MDKQKKTLKIIVIIISIICGIAAVSVISSGLSVMIYKSKTPQIIMKQNVTVYEGDTIYLSDIVETSNNVKGYLLGAEWVEINMVNNKFIDVIVSDQPEKEFQVMIPESKLDDYIKQNAELRQLSYRTLIHKHFFENIDDRFPYKQLTLQQIGIPPYDVLMVSSDKGVSYIELTADAF